MKSHKEVVSEIRKKGFADILFPLSQKEFGKSAEAFMTFLTLPQKVKERYSFMLDKANRGSTVGYKKKEQKKGDKDEKEYFHYNEFGKERFGKYKSSPHEAKIFFNHAEGIYHATTKTLNTIIQGFEADFPGIHGKFFPKDQFPHFYLRFLKYTAQGKGNFLAKGHYDRGACTLALAESAPGLRIGKKEGKAKEIVHKNKTALFFPSYRFRDATSPEFTPAWHDVVQKSEDQYKQGIARWAIVFFADYPGMNDTPWEEVHTR